MLDPRAHCGVIDYEPTELVITACSGTPLADVEATLAQHNQMLAFEPPHFGASATLGGAVASGLAGPRRMAAGSIRDFVLGATLLDGRANVLTFGGNVMKNVAGYDVSRALAGSLGTLGMILDVSLKVVPRPASEQTLRFELSEADAIRRTNEWAGQPLPISATAWLTARFRSGCPAPMAGVRAAQAKLGGSVVADDATFWKRFASKRTASSIVPRRGNLVATLGAADHRAIESRRDADRMAWRAALDLVDRTRGRNSRESARRRRTCHRVSPRMLCNDVFHPLAPALAQIHQRLKKEFDPAGIFNPGRMYSDL